MTLHEIKPNNCISREYWGICPACGHDGSTADQQAGFNFSWCRDCELLWSAGAWRDETRDEQRKNYADTFLRPEHPRTPTRYGA